MPTDIIKTLTLNSSTSSGISWSWNNYRCTITGTATATTIYNLIMANITDSPCIAGHTYQLRYSGTNVRCRCYCWQNPIGTSNNPILYQFNVISDTQFTIPVNTVGFSLRFWVSGGTTCNETVEPELYDITYTDVDADIDMMLSLVGYPNSWFYPKWVQFASGALWDGESCSEIACCVSYMAGNLSKIYVSNYAQGLIDLFRANGRYGTTPSRGAFIWFDYDGDGIGDHTGRVYKIENGIVYTFEGNVGGLTVLRQYYINDPTILGYGYPNYDNDPATDPGDPTPPKFTYLPYFRHKRRERSN